MKSSVDKLNDTRVKITVEVPFEELTPEIDQAYKALAQQVTFKGFRKGKAPRKLIDARFGRGPVLEQVVNDMLPSRYGKAVEDNDLRPLGQPAIDITKLEDGKLVEFTAEVDVRPEITIPDFSTYEIEVPELKVTDEDVDKAIDSLRERFAELKTVNRKAKKDDFVTVDLTVTVDGEEVEAASTEGLNHRIGADELIDGLDKAVKGLKTGEEVTFTSTDINGVEDGKEAEVTVTVKEVKERKLPKVDEEFVEMVSEFDTVDELREDTEKNLKEQRKVEQASAIRDEVLKKALDEANFPLPEAVVEEQVQGQLQQLIAQFGGDESMLDRVLDMQGTSREDFDKESRENAENAVRTQLFLDVLAEQEKPDVTQQEIHEHIMFTAQRYGMNPQQFLQQIQQTGQTYNLVSDVRRGKALATAICRVSVKDDAGNTVDPEEYFGEEEVEGDDAE
ncbi:trigger factor [Corynebacterium pyruviciproducens ATCC BAA-1742]|uniref:Trigger factor n=1 Tax=Corynebacterium pyruviciproducens ATCC BAA-1742 TaxID=1125779 RepID=S2ZGZ4_9CORY|nr:trigger factor [Corynebacterium pyruviciproducens]EPD69292.1 trigger factor [Corynebacterium pyruviciproducens ATCC BAA-1742]